jgi:hypothetical protein
MFDRLDGASGRPGGMHRLLFRRHRLETVVATAHRCAVAGWVAGSCTAVAVLAFWIGLPLLSRRSDNAAG